MEIGAGCAEEGNGEVMELPKVTYKEAREIWRITSCKISVESLADAINSVLSRRAPEAPSPVPEPERFTLEQVREAIISSYKTFCGESEVVFADYACARLAPKPKTPEERQKQAIISVLTFQPEYNDHPGYNPDPDKLADAIVAALKGAE
jgi:hypothetical protein